MTIAQFIAKHGTRETAQQLISQKIRSLTGGMLSLSDLPDTSAVCDLTDELEELLDDTNVEGTNKAIKDLLSTIDDDFLEQLVYA